MHDVITGQLADALEDIEQYGVKGMRWGVRKAETRGSTPPSKRKPKEPAKPKSGGGSDQSLRDRVRDFAAKRSDAKAAKAAEKAKKDADAAAEAARRRQAKAKTKRDEYKSDPQKMRELSDQEVRNRINRIKMEQELQTLLADPPKRKSEARQDLEKKLKQAGVNLAVGAVQATAIYAVNKSFPGLEIEKHMPKGGGDSKKGKDKSGGGGASSVFSTLAKNVAETYSNNKKARDAVANEAEAPAPTKERKRKRPKDRSSKSESAPQDSTPSSTPSSPAPDRGPVWNQSRPSRPDPVGTSIVRQTPDYDVVRLDNGVELQVPKVKHVDDDKRVLIQYLEDEGVVLIQYGVKGMKWGVNKRALHNTHRPVSTITGKTKLKRRGFAGKIPIVGRKKKITNRRLQRLVNEMDLNMRVKDFDKSDSAIMGRKIVDKMLEAHYRDINTARTNKRNAEQNLSNELKRIRRETKEAGRAASTARKAGDHDRAASLVNTQADRAKAQRRAARTEYKQAKRG